MLTKKSSTILTMQINQLIQSLIQSLVEIVELLWKSKSNKYLIYKTYLSFPRFPRFFLRNRTKLYLNLDLGIYIGSS